MSSHNLQVLFFLLEHLTECPSIENDNFSERFRKKLTFQNSKNGIFRATRFQYLLAEACPLRLTPSTLAWFDGDYKISRFYILRRLDSLTRSGIHTSQSIIFQCLTVVCKWGRFTIRCILAGWRVGTEDLATYCVTSNFSLLSWSCVFYVWQNTFSVVWDAAHVVNTESLIFTTLHPKWSHTKIVLFLPFKQVLIWAL